MIRIYKCPSCGSYRVYSGKAGKMVCVHCGAEAAVETVEQNALQGKDLAVGPEGADMSGSGAVELKCPSCGVTLFANDNYTAATICPACSQATLIESRLSGEFKPKYVIPFVLDKKEAKEAFKAWSKKGRLTPGSFRTDANLDKLKGVYVPAWFYTYTVNMAMSLDAEKKKTTKSGGVETTTKETYLVDLKTQATYEKVPYNADELLPNASLEVIEPYDYSKLTEFALPYLSGFFAEKYHFTAEELSERVKEALKADLAEATKKEAGSFDSLTERDVQVGFMDGKTEYVYLPVWMLQYEYGRKKFPLYMNGQTGKIDGSLPVSRLKVLLIFGIVFAAVLVALILLGRFC